MTTTVSSILSAARQRSDMVGSQFVTDAEWISYINYSYKELYDILVSKFEDYYTKEPAYTFTLATGNSVALPNDFYKMRGLDRAVSGTEYYTIHPYTFEERNNRRRATVFRGLYPNIRYRIYGGKIYFTPDDAANGDYRLWYIPLASTLTATTDTVDGVNGWEEYIIVDTCIKALTKEESDVSVFAMQKASLLKRIEEMAANRDVGETQRITDVTMGGYDNPALFTGGL